MKVEEAIKELFNEKVEGGLEKKKRKKVVSKSKSKSNEGEKGMKGMKGMKGKKGKKDKKGKKNKDMNLDLGLGLKKFSMGGMRLRA